MIRFSIPSGIRNLQRAQRVAARRWGGRWPRQIKREQQREATIERLLRESEAEATAARAVA